MSADVMSVLAGLPVTRLIHFTPASNLFGIFSDQMVRPRSALSSDAQQAFNPTDALRLDGHPDHHSCSIEFPNAYYQAQAKAKAEFINYPDWAVLVLARELMLRPGVLFSPCNAAKDCGAWCQAGGDGLARLWSSPSVPGGYVRGPNHHPAVPTDLQSEVLIPGPIPISDLSAVVMFSADKCREMFALLHSYGLRPGQVEWRWAPTLFDKLGLAHALHSKAAVAEIVWTPSDEDLI
ncbi:DarT ssDNA thymidine ADP-ribosyltransferase family protein [Mycobacteroides abscessus]